MLLTQLDTPALVADADIVEWNMRKMMEVLDGKTLKLRPHYKSNKAAVIAHKQIEMGAIGITCAKLSEAEDLVDSGIQDVLIANQIADQGKHSRIALLAKKCRLTICVDNTENAEILSKTAVESEAIIHVLIEYDIGMNRCGIADLWKYLELAKFVTHLPGLEYDGIQAYAGHVSHIILSNRMQSMT